MSKTYKVTYAHTSAVERFASYEEAIAAMKTVFADPEIGHEGDISQGGERTLIWRDEESSVNDDGSRAIAEIRLQHPDDNPMNTPVLPEE